MVAVTICAFSTGSQPSKPEEDDSSVEALLPEDQLAKVFVSGQKHGLSVPRAIQNFLVRHSGSGFGDRETS